MRDSEIRDRFREGTQPRGEIDVDAVLRRVRARRRPRVLLAGAGGVLAVTAIAVPAALSTSLPLGGTAGGASDMAESAPYSDEDVAAGGTDLVTLPKAEKLNLCAAPVAAPAPAPSGLLITVAPVSASADDRDIPTTVTLTNTGAERITGTTGSRPSLTLAEGEVTVWHTNGPQDLSARIVDLAPGQSMSYPAEFDPVRCSAADEEAEAFPADLPQLGAGLYRLSAVIEVTSDDGTVVELVSGPAVDVRLD